MPSDLRKAFIMLLVFYEPINPRSLSFKYYSHLFEDCLYKSPDNPLLLISPTINNIQTSLESMGKSLSNYGLADLLANQDHQLQSTKDIEDALRASIPTEFINAHKQLNDEQKMVYKKIMFHVENNKASAFFIDRPRGKGKTFLNCALYAILCQLRKIVLPTATFGIATSNIPLGRTSHSRFKIPVDVNVSCICSLG